MSTVLKRSLPVAAAIVAAAVCARLGYWQLQRGDQRAEEVERTRLAEAQQPMPWGGEATDPRLPRRYAVTGEWLREGQILLDNRLRDDAVGYDVVAALALADGRALPVIRGWIAHGAVVDGRPPASAGRAAITVRLLPPTTRYFELSGATVAGAVWQNFDRARYERLLGRPLAPFIAYEVDGAAGLLPNLPSRGMTPSQHYVYAGQWFLFAALAIGLCAYFQFRGRKR